MLLLFQFNTFFYINTNTFDVPCLIMFIYTVTPSEVIHNTLYLYESISSYKNGIFQ